MTATLPLAAVGTERGRAAGADEVQHAIEHSWSYLAETSTDGKLAHWETPVQHGEDGELRFTVYYALLLERMGIKKRVRDDCLDYLLDQRSPDGGWGDAVTNYAALLLLGELEDRSYRDQRRAIGQEIMDEEHSLFPSEDEQDDAVRISERFRLRLLYVLFENEFPYEDLFPEDLPLELGRLLSVTRAFEGRAVSAQETMTRPIYVGPLSAYTLLGAELQKDPSIGNEPLDEDDQRLVDALENVLLSRRLTNGAWNTTPTTIFATLALHERGYEADDPVIRTPVDWIEDNRQTQAGAVEAWRLPVWDTGLTMEALLESGFDSNDQLFEESATWLSQARTSQLEIEGAETALDRDPAPYRSEYGSGWGYMPHVFSDWDDTAVALNALSTVEDTDTQSEVEFLLDTQNRDGSWSAYTTDYDAFEFDEVQEEVEEEIPDGLYHVFFDSLQCPGVTGGALAALGSHGYTTDNSPAVRKAIDYLAGATADTDMWLGVWGQGYTYGTARVLSGVEAVADLSDLAFVTPAVEALIHEQNDDGGWGEDSKYDPASQTPGNVAYEGVGSRPTQTGWALQALLAGGLSADHEAVTDAVDYLVDSQQSDGSWTVHRTLYNIGGPAYSTEATTQAAVLKALGQYANTTA